MQTVAVSQRMDEPADQKFRSRVLRLDRRHDAGSFGLRERVSHVKEIKWLYRFWEQVRLLLKLS